MTQQQKNTSNASSQSRFDSQQWRGQFQNEPYYKAGEKYEDYESAYRTGYEGHGRHAGQRFDQVEDTLRGDWEKTKGAAAVGWDKAKHAARSAWDSIERAMPGDADRDGR